MSTRVTMTFLDGTKETVDFLYAEYGEVWKAGSYKEKRISVWTVDGWSVKFPSPPKNESERPTP